MINRDTQKLSDQVKNKLLKMIREEKVFKPGDKMPNEIVLAEKLGVSRSTLREAENELVAMNILSKSRGRGTYVLEKPEMDSESVPFDNNDSLNYTHMRLSDLYQLRKMIEPPMASLAALKSTEDDIRLMEDLNQKLSEDGMSVEDTIEYNRQFHEAIAKSTHNELIVKVFNRINNSIAKYFGQDASEHFHDENVQRVHSMLLKSMKLSDQIGARKMMEIHLNYSSDYFGLNE